MEPSPLNRGQPGARRSMFVCPFHESTGPLARPGNRNPESFCPSANARNKHNQPRKTHLGSTQRYRGEKVCCHAGADLSNLLRDLVDLVGIEPTTSSMPFPSTECHGATANNR